MEFPKAHQFDKEVYARQPLPAELASSRQWQLVYGEFRAPKYMAVMRDYITNFNWYDVKESDVAMAVKLLTVWMSISKNRLVEWPTMNAKLLEFSALLLERHERLVQIYVNITHVSWIDNEVEWYALIEEPYARLHP